ncbi:MAG: transporter [Steroidobacteraceae bacterium]|jgi:uncharacterized membrane protein YedE/YeeE|nr:transporter [Steroidobacteraceae bacterium]
MNRTVAAALMSGALFGLGLAISGMTDRHVVLGFLDLFGDFNPQLAFVLAGAVAVTAIAFRFVLRLPQPVLGTQFRVPTDTTIDRPLLLGSAIFGVGWALIGYCPGPALVGLAGGLRDAVIFVPAMLAGSFAHYLVERRGNIDAE